MVCGQVGTKRLSPEQFFDGGHCGREGAVRCVRVNHESRQGQIGGESLSRQSSLPHGEFELVQQ